MKRALIGLILLLALPYACAPVYRFPAPVRFAGAHLHNPYHRLSGGWQRANLHAHGRAWLGLTSGRQSNEEVVRRYKELGYAVAGVSNYHQIAAHDGVPTLPLYEHGYNIGKHHQLAIGAHRVAWLDYPVWQSVHHLQFIINRVAAGAELVALVHPISRGAYTREDVSLLTGYHAIEVVNGKFTHDDVWDAALSSGHPVWGIGNDDTHDLDDPERLGVGWTMIDAPSASTSDVVAALREGRAYAVVRTNQAAADTQLADVTLHGRTMTVRVAGEPALFEFIGQDGQVRKAVPDALEASYTFEDADTYIRPKIVAPRTTMYLNPVIRYDGRRLRWPVADVDAAKTYIVRAAFAGALAAAFLIYRRRSTAAAAMIVVAFAAPASAQVPDPAAPEPPAVGNAYEGDLFDDLPISDSVFAVLETLQPALISDRFANGGLFPAEPARIGGFLASPTQTLYRLDQAVISDPSDGGTPLVYPGLGVWERVDVATGLFPATINTPGTAVTLRPRPPGVAWTGIATATVSHFGSAGGTPSSGPPIVDLKSWDHVAGVASGPLLEGRVGAVFAASLTRGSQAARGDAKPLPATRGSAFAHVVFTPGDADEVRAIGWLQRATSPFAWRRPFGQPDAATTHTAAHAQASWARHLPGAPAWHAAASYTRVRRSSDADLSAGATIERLQDGPVEQLAWYGPGATSQWSFGAGIGPGRQYLAGATHAASAGIEIGGAVATAAGFVNGTVRERVDGGPARLWMFSVPAAGSRRSALTIAVHASDRLTFGDRVSAELGLRFDSQSGAARGAASDIRWRTWLPRASVRWKAVAAWQTTLTAGYGRYAYRLPLDLLAVGDPGAPRAAIYRWDGTDTTLEDLEPQVRFGPGIADDPGFSAIDADLARPVGEEFVVGIEVQPAEGLRLGLTGIARQERDLYGLVNTGAPAAAYSTIAFADPGADVLSDHDDVVVTAYNRLPQTYGADRYLLTTPQQEEPTFNGLEITFRYSEARFTLFGGATAGIARAAAASRGFGPVENDHGRLGELYTNPNAAVFARGRPFTDRAYTAKLASVLRFPSEVRLGLIARYQDGQPFARVLVVPGLNQGIEAVRAFANGDSRFTYTATLDVRLQKRLTLAGRGLEVFADAYNALNLAKQVEEITTSAPGVRITSAIQPPIMIHVGVRARF